MASLADVQAKFDRACIHAETLRLAAAKAVGGQPYFVTHQTESDGWHVFRWRIRREPDLGGLSVLYGDMLYNLRATLDYIVWQLVLANNGTPTNQHAFPIVKLSQNWAAAVGWRLQGVDPRWINAIAQLQPFDPSHGGIPERHPLAVLGYVNDCNKHRLLSPAVAVLQMFTYQLGIIVPNTSVAQVLAPPGAPVEDNAEVLRIRTPSGEPFTVDVDREPAFQILFRDGLDHSDGWHYTNGTLIEGVRNAIAVFEPAFPS